MGQRLELSDFGEHERMLAAIQRGPYGASDLKDLYALPDRFPVDFHTHYAVAFEFTSGCVGSKITPKFTSLFHFSNGNAFWDRYAVQITGEAPPYLKPKYVPLQLKAQTIMKIAEAYIVWRTCLFLDLIATNIDHRDIVPLVRKALVGNMIVPYSKNLEKNVEVYISK